MHLQNNGSTDHALWQQNIAMSARDEKRMLTLFWDEDGAMSNGSESTGIAEKLGGCPLSGKSSMCLKYRIILLIVIKNPRIWNA